MLFRSVSQSRYQSIGSAITYGRRYMLLAQLGLAPDDEDDDDGNKASARTATPQNTPRQQTAKPATNGTQHRQTAQPVQKPSQVDAVIELDDAAIAEIVKVARTQFESEVLTTVISDDMTPPASGAFPESGWPPPRPADQDDHRAAPAAP